MEGDVITMQEIFVFEKAGVTQDGKGDRRSAPPACGRRCASG